MSEWRTITFKFDIFDPLRPPIETLLSILETIEAILEALLALLRPFLLDLLNPLRAIIAALLAALRALINQIRSTGFAVLLVHPDFSIPDWAGVLYSVSGAYPGFESKVVGKFFDTSDIFRPQYPPGSTVGMLVLYIGADSPGDLLGLLFALLALIRHPINLTGLPAPIDVKAVPIDKSGSSISQFRKLFDSDLNQAVQLEWRMPQSPSALGASGFVGQIVSIYNQFRFPNFIIERQGPFPQNDSGVQLDSRGDLVTIRTESNNMGPIINATMDRYGFPRPNSLIPLREEDGTIYRNFVTKKVIQFGGTGEVEEGRAQGSAVSALAADTALITGIATGTYKYLDESNDLVAGRTYYYRIRAFFGDATDYLSLDTVDAVRNSGLVKREGNRQILRLSPKLTLSRPSRIVKGFVPRKTPSAAAFQAYEDIYNGIIAGILLNFEFPSANTEDTPERLDQKVGWGVLGVLGGQLGPLKAAFDTSDELKDNVFVQATARRLANLSAEKLFTQPRLTDILINQWVGGGAQATVDKVLNQINRQWKFIAIVGGVTSDNVDRINAYLALEPTDNIVTDSTEPYPGPVPLNVVSVQERQDLADFLRTAIAIIGFQSGYLSWYSITVGDLFPALLPFIFDFEQWLKDLLNAINSALKEIEDIIETLLQKIRALKQFLETILAILDILEINISLSVLPVGPTTNGSAESLAQSLIDSINKPGDSPFGLHSGLVFTFGGPGEGFVAALKAIKFILTIPF